MDILAEPIEQDVTTDGQTPAGALFISVKNTGSAPAQFNGVALSAGEAKSYGFIGKGYKALAYQVNSSSLRIMYVI